MFYSCVVCDEIPARHIFPSSRGKTFKSGRINGISYQALDRDHNICGPSDLSTTETRKNEPACMAF